MIRLIDHDSRNNVTLPISRLVVGLWLVLATIVACGEEGPTITGPRADIAPGPIENILPQDVDSDGDGLRDTAEETLIRRYRPYWDYDGQEAIRPLSIEDWASLGSHIQASFSNGTDREPYNNVSTLSFAVSRFPNGVMKTTDNLVHGYPFCNVGDQVQGGCNNAPIVVDAVRMPSGFCIKDAANVNRCNLVWLHYYILFSADYKAGYFPLSIQHKGDWEHICVMADTLAIANKTIRPVQMHWHHHQTADVSKSPWAYHSDSWGSYHPRAFVEQLAHGIYKNPESSWSDGGGSPDNPLNNPIVFMTPHWTNRSSLVDDIVRNFSGWWGHTNGVLPGTKSSRGPMVWNQVCDHDYRARPTSLDWADDC